MTGLRTSKGNVTAQARKKHGGDEGRFPIFDKRSAEAALKLRGHAKTPAERSRIFRLAAQYLPAETIRLAREADKKKGTS